MRPLAATVMGDIWFIECPRYRPLQAASLARSARPLRAARRCRRPFRPATGRRLDDAAHDMLVHAADAADAEAVHHGQLARIDDEALVLHQFVEAVEGEVRMRRAKECDDDRRQPAVRQQRLEAELAHAGDHHVAVRGVARATRRRRRLRPRACAALRGRPRRRASAA